MISFNHTFDFQARVSAAAGRAWRFSPMLTILVAANIGLCVLALAGLLVDPRQILGAPAWAKTLKFSISVTIYGATLLWMLSYVKSQPRAAKTVAFASGVTLLLEMMLIVLQALRGIPSHFNQSTPFDTLVWRTMSISIGIFYVFDIVGGVLLARERFANPVLGLGIKLGLGMALVGFGLGGLMTAPTSEQLAALGRGGQLDFLGAHTVGALIDGQTRMIPILGWNMDGGDLRIPHFVGIHGAQIIPLIALIALAYGARGLSVTRMRALVVMGAAAYFGLTMLVAWQALRNESIASPGAETLAAAAILAAATVLSAGVVLGRRPAADLPLPTMASRGD